ncbi:MAG: hypothetical protein CSA81_09590 [Acidobacteria bacterium]|nr:MAG: hypothetical protein CSA81_09590 [Acidobacteriota bacterium]
MKEQRVEQVVFDDGQGGEEYFLILDRFTWSGSDYAFMLEMKDERTVLQKEDKPVFIVMREKDQDFFDLSKEEAEAISKQVKQNWETINRRLQELEGHAQ